MCPTCAESASGCRYADAAASPADIAACAAADSTSLAARCAASAPIRCAFVRGPPAANAAAASTASRGRASPGAAFSNTSRTSSAHATVNVVTARSSCSVSTKSGTRLPRDVATAPAYGSVRARADDRSRPLRHRGRARTMPARNHVPLARPSRASLSHTAVVTRSVGSDTERHIPGAAATPARTRVAEHCFRHRGIAMTEPHLADLLSTSDRDAFWAEIGPMPPVRRGRYFDQSPIWLVTGYDEALAVLKDPGSFSNDINTCKDAVDVLAAAGLPDDVAPYLSQTLGAYDPPDHARLRRLVSREFTVRRVESLRPLIQTMVDELVDGFPDEPFDFLERFAHPLPVRVICKLLGV